MTRVYMTATVSAQRENVGEKHLAGLALCISLLALSVLLTKKRIGLQYYFDFALFSWMPCVASILFGWSVPFASSSSCDP